MVIGPDKTLLEKEPSIATQRPVVTPTIMWSGCITETPIHTLLPDVKREKVKDPDNSMWRVISASF